MCKTIPGLFHVTSELGWSGIIKEGKIVPGVDLHYSGRYDIHMLIAPPYPDDLAASGRLHKGDRRGRCVILSINPEGLRLGDARLNQQGFVLRHTPISWGHIDYAMLLDPQKGG